MYRLSYEQKTDMTYRAMFGERDTRTLKIHWGVYDIVRWLVFLNAVTCAHAFGVPTEKIGEMIAGFFTAAAAELGHVSLPH